MNSIETILRKHLQDIDKFVKNLYKNKPTTQDEQDEFDTFMLDVNEDKSNTLEAIDALCEYCIVKKLDIPIVVISGIRGKNNAEVFTHYLNTQSKIYKYEYRQQI